MPRVRVHDHLQLELKVLHALDGSAAARGLEAWLFFPNSLGIDEPVFRKEDFYEDLTAYVRFQTPKRSLAALIADENASLAWLARNSGQLRSGAATPAECATALRALRMFAAEFRASVRDATVAMTGACQGAAALGEGRGSGLLDEQAAVAVRFLDASQALLQRFRALRQALSETHTPELVRAALSAIDDFLSLHAIEAWFQLLQLCQAHPVLEAGAPSEPVRAALQREIRYRHGAGFIGAPSDDPAANEPYIARVNQLKKWVLEVLHLHVLSSRRAERVRSAAFSVAAAVAMTVAVALQLVAAWTVGTPKSPQVGGSTLAAFVGLAVGGYILKDGIKDRLKVWFQSGIPLWLFDRRNNLRIDERGEEVGAVEETVRRIGPRELPPEVARLRERGEDPLFAHYRAEEDILHYRRRIRLDSRRIGLRAPEMSCVDEILRLNVGRWLRRMDDPTRALTRLEPDGRVVHVGATKTYRVTLVLARQSGREAPTYERFCLVLSRDGLLRVE